LGFTVTVEAFIYPTEDPELVEKAVRNMFNGELKVEEADGSGLGLLKVTGFSDRLEALTPLKEVVKRERIRAAARAALLSSISGGVLRFHLNKQVAYAGYVSICQPERESPLGPITITVMGEDVRKAVEWLTQGEPEPEGGGKS